LSKQSYIVGTICLLLGGLAGYIAGVQTTLKQANQLTQTQPAPQTAAPLSGDSGAALPEGHPPITTQEDFDTLKKAVEAAPANSSLIAELANKFYDAGRYNEAITYYQRALKLEPQSVNIITDLGTALFYSGKPDEALVEYNRSLQIDPRHVQSLHNMVIVYLQGKKDVKAAAEALARLKSVDPSNPSIPNLQAMLSQGGTPAANPRQRIF
jgi:tetratricopeptide (TPR) repeat protein